MTTTTTQPRWHRIEAYLADHHNLGSTFSVHDYAAESDQEVPEATLDIQAYLTAQRGKRRPTAFVLYRVDGRTRAAHWRVGERVSDVRALGEMFYDDTATKLTRALMNDLQAQGNLNPRVRGKVEIISESVSKHAMGMLELAVKGMIDEG